MKKINCWVIFVFRRRGDQTEILLFQKNQLWEPVCVEEKDFSGVREHLHRLLNLKEKDFYSGRDVDWFKAFSVGKKDEVIYKIAASAARIKEGTKITVPAGFQQIGWFKKAKALEKLNHWKGYLRAFKNVFPEKDTFWEAAV